MDKYLAAENTGVAEDLSVHKTQWEVLRCWHVSQSDLEVVSADVKRSQPSETLVTRTLTGGLIDLQIAKDGFMINVFLDPDGNLQHVPVGNINDIRKVEFDEIGGIPVEVCDVSHIRATGALPQSTGLRLLGMHASHLIGGLARRATFTGGADQFDRARAMPGHRRLMRSRGTDRSLPTASSAMMECPCHPTRRSQSTR